MNFPNCKTLYHYIFQGRLLYIQPVGRRISSWICLFFPGNFEMASSQKTGPNCIYRKHYSHWYGGARCVPLRAHCRHHFCTAGAATAQQSVLRECKLRTRTAWLRKVNLSNDLTRGYQISHYLAFGKVIQEVVWQSNHDFSVSILFVLNNRCP